MKKYRIFGTLRHSAALVALVAAGAVGVTASPTQAQDRVYVTNQGEATISIIDVERLEVIETLDLKPLGFSENAKPHHIAVEPDGSFWYVSLIGENRVLKFNRQNGLVAQAEFEVPGMLALDGSSDMLYVGRSMSAVNPPMRIGAITRSDMSIDEIDVLFPRPHALIVNPSGAQIYSASLGMNRLGAVDAESWDVEFVDVPGETHALVQFAVSPNGRTLAVTGELTGDLLVFDLAANPASPQLQTAVDVGSRPWHPIFGRDDRHVYFGNKGDNTLVEVDVVEGRVSRTFSAPGIDQPHGAALSPDGSLLFISNNGPGGMGMNHGPDSMDHAAMDHAAMDHGAMDHGDHEASVSYETGTVAVVDLASGEVIAMIPVGKNATGIGAASPR